MLILKVKKAMTDVGYYRGVIDENWEPSDSLAWLSFCNRFGGFYTPEPAYHLQDQDFKNMIDSIDVSEYTIPKVQIASSGMDVRQLIPEKQSLGDTEGLSKEQIRRIDSMVNENVVKPGDSFLPTKPASKVTPEDVVRMERLYNKDSVKIEPQEPSVQKTSVTTIRTR